jgi:hypothetical protein
MVAMVFFDSTPLKKKGKEEERVREEVFFFFSFPLFSSEYFFLP